MIFLSLIMLDHLIIDNLRSQIHLQRLWNIQGRASTQISLIKIVHIVEEIKRETKSRVMIRMMIMIWVTNLLILSKVLTMNLMVKQESHYSILRTFHQSKRKKRNRKIDLKETLMIIEIGWKMRNHQHISCEINNMYKLII